MKKTRREIETRVENTVALGHFGGAAELDPASVATDPQRAAMVAHDLIYRGRLGEAAEVLQPFGESIDQGINLVDAAELGLARAELAYWNGQYEESHRSAENVLGIFRIMGDKFGEGRALYLLGRIARRQGDFESAMRQLVRAEDVVSALPASKNRFLLGCIHHNRGVIHQQLGEIEVAQSFLVKALAELKATENGRFYGIALNSYGVLLKTKGDYAESTRTYQRAIDLLSAQASFDDLAHAINNLAYVQILTGQWDQSEKNLRESLELRRRAGDIAGEAGTLELLGRLNLERGSYEEAEKNFKSSIEMAELARNDHEKALALIGLGMLLNKMGRGERAKASLEQANRLAIQLKSKMLEAQTSAYLAESCALEGSGLEAQGNLARARELLKDYHDWHLASEVARLEEVLRGEKIRMTDGTFTIKNTFMPTWREAHDALGRFLLGESLKSSGGSQVQAARMLGVTKAYITMLRRKHQV